MAEPKDFTARYPARKFDVMYYVDDDTLTIDPVQAFYCEPNDPDELRWVPEKGFSVSVGYRVFFDTRDAHIRLYKELRNEKARLEPRLKRVDELLERYSPYAKQCQKSENSSPAQPETPTNTN